MQDSPNLINYLSAVGSIATPVIVLIFGAMGWKYRQNHERKIRLEEWLKDDRIETYNNILEPYIIMLMPDAAWKTNPKNKNIDKSEYAANKLLSLEYRKNAFKLSLIGSDSVYEAYCNLMQNSYLSTASNDENETWRNSQKMMSLMGSFLLEIRKSMGNETTKIDNWKMLEWFITDIKTFKQDLS